MIDTVLDRLQGVKRMGKGATARCPAHDDRQNSLKVDPGDDGRVLMFCHAGCSFEDVVRALGLEIEALMPEKPQSFKLRDAVETYDYHDEKGRVRFRVGRFVPKDFRQFQPDGTSGGLREAGIHPIPYRLPKVLEATQKSKYVFVVEGEKDVHTLEKLGFIATTNPGGAGRNKWNPEWAAYFVDAFVAILPDNDDAGRAHADEVARSLVDVAKAVKIIDLSVPSKGDVTDWVRSGHGAEELKQMVKSARRWSPQSQRLAMQVTTISDVQTTRVEWLWPDYLPLGKIVTLEGDPGQGKSTITLDLAAKLSTASPLPDSYRPNAPTSVLLFTAEDSLSDTIRPRLEAVDADLTKIHAVTAVNTDEGPRPLAVPDDIEQLEAAITAYETKLVIIDPFIQFLSSEIDSHNDHQVRRAMYPLTELAERTGACIVLMRHLTKGQGKAMYRGGGSIGITGAIRLGMVVGTDPSTKKRVLAVYKSNLSKIPMPMGYTIVPAELRGVGRIKWLGEVDCTPDELVASPVPNKVRKMLVEDE